jgi:isopentenyl phosphate kinase
MLTVLKIGGSLITDKSSEEPKIDLQNTKRISLEIAQALPQIESLVLVHGAGSYGHPIVKRTGINKGLNGKVLDFAETQRLQNELNQLFCKELISQGVPAFPFQVSSNAVMRDGDLVFFDLQNLKGLLSHGLVPVLYGVPVFDKIMGCSILSGDTIVPYIAKELKGRILFATNIDGVYNSNPEVDDKARLITRIDGEFNDFWQSSNADVTGGMFKKVKEIIESGREGFIFNGLVEGNIAKALTGKNVRGTNILSQ